MPTPSPEIILELLPCSLTVCKTRSNAAAAPIPHDSALIFTGCTDEENSLVCETRCVPPDALVRDDGWSAFRIRGVLDFSLIGILARIASVLADADISIFAVSTYNTDYILVKDAPGARAALTAAGYTVIQA